jgi:hypothetical protein
VRREPETTSAAPRTIGSISAGTSMGSYSMSASWITTMSPSTCASPVRIAEPLPPFGLRTTRIFRSRSHCSRIAAVPSVEPSSNDDYLLVERQDIDPGQHLGDGGRLVEDGNDEAHTRERRSRRERAARVRR